VREDAVGPLTVGQGDRGDGRYFFDGSLSMAWFSYGGEGSVWQNKNPPRFGSGVLEIRVTQFRTGLPRGEAARLAATQIQITIHGRKVAV